jgi:hypothetical protein
VVAGVLVVVLAGGAGVVLGAHGVVSVFCGLFLADRSSFDLAENKNPGKTP